GDHVTERRDGENLFERLHQCRRISRGEASEKRCPCRERLDPRPDEGCQFFLCLAYAHLSRTARSDFSHCGMASLRSFVQFSCSLVGQSNVTDHSTNARFPSTIGVTRPVPW